MYLKEDITHIPLEGLDLKFRFAAVDLAPNEQLETGFSAIDRERQIIRMDKLYQDKDIINTILNLGPPSGTVVVVDMPKSLSIPGRWAQEEIKMHAFRLRRPSGQEINRFEERGVRLYEALKDMGFLVFLYFNYWTRVNYDMLIPFRSRSPQGCRALQTAIEHQLNVKNLPNNLAPSSVLESLVGAYASWSLWAGRPSEDYELYLNEYGHRLMIPKERPHLRQTPQPTRRGRRSRSIR
jgi:hypothetical protein